MLEDKFDLIKHHFHRHHLQNTKNNSTIITNQHDRTLTIMNTFEIFAFFTIVLIHKSAICWTSKIFDFTIFSCETTFTLTSRRILFTCTTIQTLTIFIYQRFLTEHSWKSYWTRANLLAYNCTNASILTWTSQRSYCCCCHRCCCS